MYLMTMACDVVMGIIYLFCFFLVMQMVISGLSWLISCAAEIWQSRQKSE